MHQVQYFDGAVILIIRAQMNKVDYRGCCVRRGCSLHPVTSTVSLQRPAFIVHDRQCQGQDRSCLLSASMSVLSPDSRRGQHNTTIQTALSRIQNSAIHFLNMFNEIEMLACMTRSNDHFVTISQLFI